MGWFGWQACFPGHKATRVQRRPGGGAKGPGGGGRFGVFKGQRSWGL